jgi:hypothetical protein
MSRGPEADGPVSATSGHSAKRHYRTLRAGGGTPKSGMSTWGRKRTFPALALFNGKAMLVRDSGGKARCLTVTPTIGCCCYFR